MTNTRYLYTGVTNLSGLSSSDILKLLIAADELGIPELIEYAQSKLIEDSHLWIPKKFVQMMHTVKRHDVFTKLKIFTEDIIRQQPHLILASEDFETLQESEF